MTSPFLKNFGPPSPSSQSGLRRAGLVLAAFLASAASIGIIFVLLLPKGLPLTAASILPAEQTVALFEEVLAERIRDATGLFRALTSAPIYEGGSLALVKYSCGEGCSDLGWISFQKKRDTEEGSVIGPWRVRVSSPALLPMLREGGTGRLLSMNAFKQGRRTGTEEIYLSLGILPGPVDLTDHMLSTLLQGSASMTMAETGSGWTITIAHPPPMLSPSIAESILHPSDTDISMSLGDGRRLWKTMEERMDPPLRRILYALVGSETERLLGNDVSFTYDVLPLLQKPFTAHVSKSGSALRFALGGSMDDRNDLATNIGQLHQSVERSLPTATVITRDLDEFRSVLVKLNASLLEKTEGNEGSWTMRSTRHRETGAGLISATRGDRFILGNDPALVTALMEGEGTHISFPTLRIGNRSVLGGGIVDLAPWRSEMTWTPWKQMMLGAVLRHEGPLIWHVEKSSNALVISFQKMRGQ